jgi:hypothetical protein
VSPSGPHKLLSKPRLRLALSLLCLIACTFQSFVAQTHFHGHAATLSARACLPDLSQNSVSAQNAELEGSCNSSGGSGSSPCPLCQIVLQGDAAALPAHDWDLSRVLAAGIPAAAASSFSFIITAVSFDWNSRGPPLT